MAKRPQTPPGTDSPEVKDTAMIGKFRDLHEPIPPERQGFSARAASSQPSTVTIDDSELHQQVLDIIQNVLSTADPRSEVRRRLLRHLAEHPGHPEQALLDHLRDRNRRGGRPQPAAGHGSRLDPHL